MPDPSTLCQRSVQGHDTLGNDRPSRPLGRRPNAQEPEACRYGRAQDRPVRQCATRSLARRACSAEWSRLAGILPPGVCANATGSKLTRRIRNSSVLNICTSSARTRSIRRTRVQPEWIATTCHSPARSHVRQTEWLDRFGKCLWTKLATAWRAGLHYSPAETHRKND